MHISQHLLIHSIREPAGSTDPDGYNYCCLALAFCCYPTNTKCQNWTSTGRVQMTSVHLHAMFQHICSALLCSSALFCTTQKPMAGILSDFSPHMVPYKKLCMPAGHNSAKLKSCNTCPAVDNFKQKALQDTSSKTEPASNPLFPSNFFLFPNNHKAVDCMSSPQPCSPPVPCAG